MPVTESRSNTSSWASCGSIARRWRRNRRPINVASDRTASFIRPVEPDVGIRHRDRPAGCGTGGCGLSGASSSSMLKVVRPSLRAVSLAREPASASTTGSGIAASTWTSASPVGWRARPDRGRMTQPARRQAQKAGTNSKALETARATMRPGPMPRVASPAARLSERRQSAS